MSCYHEEIPEGRYTLPVGKYGSTIDLSIENDRYFMDFRFNRELTTLIKSSLEKYKYHGYDEVNPRKVWSCAITKRNNFRLRFLMGINVYEWYDAPIPEIEFKRPLFEAQRKMVGHCVQHKRCEIAGEMGTGKTLAAIETMERSGGGLWYWVGPKSALAAVKLDLRKWKCSVTPEFFTYEGFTKKVNSGEMEVPKGIVFDEASKLKNAKTKRTTAAMDAADAILESDGYLILMSGTPAPKSPVDWWAQTEMCCPGFLKEPTPEAMKYTMAFIEEIEGLEGTTFPKLIGWKDSDKRCDVCGHFENDPLHFCYKHEEIIKREIIEKRRNGVSTIELEVTLRRIQDTKSLQTGMHDFVPATNEVARLYKRLRGLVLPVFKKDCLDLPDKFYRPIECTPPADMIRSAEAVDQMHRKVTARMKKRQIIDGFLYSKRKSGERKCQSCAGEGKISFWWSDDLMCIVPEGTENAVFREDQPCPECAGEGSIDVFEEFTQEITSPKEAVVVDLLDEFDDCGRIVISAAFTASIDKLTALVVRQGWEFIRLDGRGWSTSWGLKEPVEILEAFQDTTGPEKIAFIMHPESGGMGLTLTASPAIIIYSNTDKLEDRLQLEDRIHRPGMDVNKGATIIDLFCLDVDRMIYDNNGNKHDLQQLTLRGGGD